MTHSQGGMPGWEAALYTDNIASIIVFEPGFGPTVLMFLMHLFKKKFHLLFIMEIILELLTNIHQSQLLQCGII